MICDVLIYEDLKSAHIVLGGEYLGEVGIVVIIVVSVDKLVEIEELVDRRISAEAVVLTDGALVGNNAVSHLSGDISCKGIFVIVITRSACAYVAILGIVRNAGIVLYEGLLVVLKLCAGNLSLSGPNVVNESTPVCDLNAHINKLVFTSVEDIRMIVGGVEVVNEIGEFSGLGEELGDLFNYINYLRVVSARLGDEDVIKLLKEGGLSNQRFCQIK